MSISIPGFQIVSLAAKHLNPMPSSIWTGQLEDHSNEYVRLYIYTEHLGIRNISNTAKDIAGQKY
jgi:hypothetical protein